jgi:ribonuclease HI
MWGLGITTNNIAEAYALFEGLRMAKEHMISQILVFGDSMLIVKEIITRNLVENNLLRGVLHHIINLIKALMTSNSSILSKA